jgi:hypothetical protein
MTTTTTTTAFYITQTTTNNWSTKKVPFLELHQQSLSVSTQQQQQQHFLRLLALNGNDDNNNSYDDTNYSITNYEDLGNKYLYSDNDNDENSSSSSMFSSTSVATSPFVSSSTFAAESESSAAAGEWSVTDNWNKLSIENPDNAAIESRKQFDQRFTRGMFPTTATATASTSSTLLHSRIDKITGKQQVQQKQNGEDSDAQEDSRLQDFITTMYVDDIDVDIDTDTNNDNLLTTFNEEEMSREIALLIRCNERPESILIQQGRAIPELTAEQLYNVSQLVQLVLVPPKQSNNTNNDERTTTASTTPTWVATPFLQQAVLSMYEQHITTTVKINGHEEVIKKFDSQAIASWLSTSLQTTTIIGQHDQRVTTILAKYSS